MTKDAKLVAYLGRFGLNVTFISAIVKHETPVKKTLTTTSTEL